MIEKRKKMNKTYSSLTIKTEFSEKINRIIIEEFLKEKSKKNAVIFLRKSKIIQCYNYYEYNHIKKCARISRNAIIVQKITRRIDAVKTK